MRFKINCVQLLSREIWCGYYLDLIMAIFGHVGKKERGNERMNNFSTNEEGKIDYAKKYLSCSNCSNNQNGHSYHLLTNTCLADSNGGSIKAVFGPVVTRSVATTASKVKFCQKEKCLRHCVLGIRDVFCIFSPVNGYTSFFVRSIWMVVTRVLMFTIWHKSEQAVGISVAVFKLDYAAIRLETLIRFLIRHWFRKDAKENVFLHEVVLWLGVTRVVVDQYTKINISVIWMGLNQSVGLLAFAFFLQLQQNIFPVFKESVNNLHTIWSIRDAMRKKSETTSFNVKFTEYLNRPCLL